MQSTKFSFYWNNTVLLHIFKFVSAVTLTYGQVVANQRLKTIEKVKSPALKVVAVAYERI